MVQGRTSKGACSLNWCAAHWNTKTLEEFRETRFVRASARVKMRGHRVNGSTLLVGTS